jgi:hypothetical protein
MTAVHSRQRIALALVCGLLCAWATLRSFGVFTKYVDFVQLWAGGRAILEGHNPYSTVGPGLPFQWPWPLLYPLPAAIVAIPLAPLSALAATAVFGGIAGAVFAWALMEHGYAPLAGFFSAALMAAVRAGQWSPLLAGAMAAPVIGVLFICKPTVGAAYFIARPSWWALGGGAALALVSFAISPTWFADWLVAIKQNAAIWYPHTSYRPIVTEPGGIIAVACLLRWRRAEGRLVTAIACVPLTPMPYEMVALFLVPRTAGEAALLSATTWGVQFWLDGMITSIPTFSGRYDYTAQLMAATAYPLATLMVLRRPNVGPLPVWLEERIAGWPRWLRGSSSAAAA